MSSHLKAANFLVFLGKSLFSFLEGIVFAIISKPRKNVAGEIVLITGAGSGLGRLLALQFARLGSVLILWDINKEGNEETCQLALNAGAMKVHAYTCDCSRREEVYKVADQVNQEHFLWVVKNPNTWKYIGIVLFCLSQFLCICL